MSMPKVVWQEGMLLRPQHFQQNDRYYDQQLKSRTQKLISHAWGFFSLEIDAQFLNMGKLVISHASGVLPDGSLFDIGNEKEPLAIDVPPNTSSTPVYLALPLVTSNHVETRRPNQRDVLARYTAHETEVADSNAGDSSASQVSCAQPDFRLLLGQHPNEQAFVRLQICEVQDSTPDAVISLNPEYVPTYLHTHASSYLLSCLKEVVSMLAHRGDMLAERIRATGKMGSSEVGDFMMLQLINRCEPVLRHLLKLEQVHPEQIYRELLALLGELSTYSSESKRPKHDSYYQHSDQGQSFRKLMDAIRQVLSMVLEQHAVELPLQERQYGVNACPHTLRSAQWNVFVSWSICICRASRSNRYPSPHGRFRSTPAKPISPSSSLRKSWHNWSVPVVSPSTCQVKSAGWISRSGPSGAKQDDQGNGIQSG